MCKLGAVGQREVEYVLRTQGWQHVRSKGGHRQWVFPGSPLMVTTLDQRGSYHTETLSRMLRQMCLSKEAFGKILRGSK